MHPYERRWREIRRQERWERLRRACLVMVVIVVILGAYSSAFHWAGVRQAESVRAIDELQADNATLRDKLVLLEADRGACGDHRGR
jgi:hypothetical protein